jgi:hypothetical protein
VAWAVVWQDADRTECETFLTELEAKRSYDTLRAKKVTAVMLDDDSKTIHESESLTDDQKKRFAELALQHIEEAKRISLQVIDIKKATFGEADVTERATSMYKEGTRRFFPAVTTWLEDGPEAPGTCKLSIEFSLDGQASQTVITIEGGDSPASLPDGILQSEAAQGDQAMHDKIGGKRLYKDWQRRREQQISKIKKLYHEHWLLRLLRMVEIFSLMAQQRQHPLSMVQKVASPAQIENLLRLLVGGSPRVKVIVLKIIQNLVALKLPNELFSEAVGRVTQDENSLASQILRFDSKFKLKGSAFLQFLFNYFLRVRSFLWSRRDIESEGMHAVSQVMSAVLRVMSTIEGEEGENAFWPQELRAQAAESLLELDTLALRDLDTIMCLFPGGEFDGLSAGDIAVTSKDETVTVLGFSETWKVPDKLIGAKSEKEELFETIRGVRVTADFSGPKDKVVALFYDKNAKQHSDFMLLNPANLSVKSDLESDAAQAIAKKSPLENEKVVQKLLATLASYKSVDSQRSRLTQSLILKILVN